MWVAIASFGFCSQSLSTRVLMASWLQRSESCAPLHAERHALHTLGLSVTKQAKIFVIGCIPERLQHFLRLGALLYWCTVTRGPASLSAPFFRLPRPPHPPRAKPSCCKRPPRQPPLSPPHRPLEHLHSHHQHKKLNNLRVSQRFAKSGPNPLLAQSVPPNRPLFRSSTCRSRASMFAWPLP